MRKISKGQRVKFVITGSLHLEQDGFGMERNTQRQIRADFERLAAAFNGKPQAEGDCFRLTASRRRLLSFNGKPKATAFV
ncbi:MAG: hypothetical protein R3C53_11985 [Pirellulaceae bacterium]